MTDSNLSPGNATLLPCPFCGSEAEFERHGTNRQSSIVACQECGARVETSETWNEGQLWNTRTHAQTPFNGTVELSTEEFDALEKTMIEPQEPTEGIKRGAALLDKLYGGNVPAQGGPDRHALAAMLKSNGFCSRDGTVIQGGTLGVIDAIISALPSTERP